MALVHPKESIGPHSSSNWVQPKRDNQIPKLEKSAKFEKSEEKASFSRLGSQPRANKIGGQERKQRHAGKGRRKLLFYFFYLLLFFNTRQKFYFNPIQVYMCVKLPSGDLNPCLYPLYSRNTYTCRVTTTPRVRGGRRKLLDKASITFTLNALYQLSLPHLMA